MARKRKKHDPEVADPAPLAEALGVDFVPELLDLALTHSSWGYEHDGAPDNERLEFLGDSVLGMAVAQLLYREYPDLSEGELSPRHHALVSTVTLAEIGRREGIGEYLRLGRSEQLTGGWDKDSILADAVEALIGAAYLSRGYLEAEAFVVRLLDPYLDQVDRLGAAMDPKTALQEVVTANKAENPEYAVEGTGPDHDRSYEATVTVHRGRQQLVSATGVGPSKKQAEMAAALEAWYELSGTERPQA
ncbi:ribonuclease III [Gulosibacter massiliensis]|uniref:ribonuclease III n=1 Tax=Gulosibacter massiliensis TaxID=2479839 RepID=UPI000F638CE8|nr:ribonuclease III [Gulosibacter massiliensis]